MKGFALVLALLPFAASAATITVNTTTDTTTAGDGHCTLREAIANVNALAIDPSTPSTLYAGTAAASACPHGIPSGGSIDARKGDRRQ